MKIVLFICVTFYFGQIVNGINTYYMDQQCGKILDLSSMLQEEINLQLTSRLSYQSNMRCPLTIRTENGSNLMLYFKSFDVLFTTYCTSDYLQVINGNTIIGPYVTGLSGNQCGYMGSTVYITTGPYLTLYFQSDSALKWHSGFSMIITSYHYGYCYGSEYRCANGRCIANDLTCNSYNPCGDYSDCTLVLTGGSIAGIVIGCFVFCILIVTIVIFSRRRYNRTVTRTVTTSYGTSGAGYNQPVPQQYPPLSYPVGQQYPPSYQPK